MSAHNRQLTGWIVVVAVVISVVSTILGLVIHGPLGSDGPPSHVVSLLNVCAGILFLVSLPMVYRVQRPQIGILGLIGVIGLWLTIVLFNIVLSIVNLTVVSSSQASALASNPYLPMLFLGGALLQVIASVLFGLGVIRARIFSPFIGWLLIASSLAVLLDFPLSGISELVVQTLSDMLLLLSMGWLGFAIIASASKTTPQLVSIAK